MRLRAPRESEAEAVHALLQARDIADLGRPDFTLGDLLDEWSASEFDLAANAVVCELETGELAGYAVVQRPGTFGAVHPDREGAGIGARLLEWCETRQRALGWREHRTTVFGGSQRAEELVRSRGYGLVRSYWRMVTPLAEPPAGVELPDGVRFRALAPEQDAAAVYDVNVSAFASVAGTEPESLQAFIEEHLQAHDLDAALSIVAVRDGRVVGFALVRRWEQESAGFVDLLGVAPGVQGKGLGRVLLLSVLKALRTAGLAEAQLGVAGDNSNALGLYESVGMRPRFRVDVYERAVAGAER